MGTLTVTRLHRLRAEVAGACRVPAIGTPVADLDCHDLAWAEANGVVDVPVFHLSATGSGGSGYGGGHGGSYGSDHGGGYGSGGSGGYGYGYGGGGYGGYGIYGYGDGSGEGPGRHPRSALELAVEEYRAAMGEHPQRRPTPHENMSDTPTVYIVTAGEYSDYHITAVFQTKAEAEEYIEWRWGHQDFPDGRIEEWSVGWPAKHRSRTGLWRACGSRGDESPCLMFDPEGGDKEESTTIRTNDPYSGIRIHRHDRERAIRAYQQARRDLWMMLDRGEDDE